MKILLIEDDAETAAYVTEGLKEHGHVVDRSANGRDGLYLATNASYAVIIVDRMLPGLDGLKIVKALRSTGSQVPILFLTTMSGIDDRVAGLDAGADDYMVKPFAFSELLARVNALARRPPLGSAEPQTRLKVSDLELDLVRRTATRAGKRIDLQPQEFKLLEYLMRQTDKVVTRTMLLENVWNFHFDPRTSVVESHISRLRSKIDRGFSPELIHTVRGAGYTLRVQD